MNAYMPKVGDKVRATLGETVVIGRVSDLDWYEGFLVGAVVYPSERSFAQLELSVPDWQFTQVVSVPSKFGAVIRRADGALFRHGTLYNWWDQHGQGTDPGTATKGGFTILFDGVDE
jgi:hypothetical protein